MTSPMTFAEFTEHVTRLHKRFPWIYSCRKQVEIAFLVSGLPLEWFKTRVDYVIRSGDGRYDWSSALRVKALVNVTAVVIPEISNFDSNNAPISSFEEQMVSGRIEVAQAFAVTPDQLVVESTSFVGMLEREGVSSATELLDKLSKKGGKDE